MKQLQLYYEMLNYGLIFIDGIEIYEVFMKKNITFISLVSILIFAIFLMGCQPTPKKQVVAKSDGKKLEEMINSTKEPISEVVTEQPTAESTAEINDDLVRYSGVLNLPVIDHWKEKVVVENKNHSVITFDIDADVLAMENDVYAVARVRKKEFAVEDAHKYIDYFMGGKKIYEDMPRRLTRVDRCEDKILKLKQARAILNSLDKYDADKKQKKLDRIDSNIELCEQMIEYYNQNGKMPEVKWGMSKDGKQTFKLVEPSEDYKEVQYINNEEYDPYKKFCYEFKKQEDGHGGYYDTYEMKAKIYNDDDTSNNIRITNSKHSNYYRLEYKKGLEYPYYGKNNPYTNNVPCGMNMTFDESLGVAIKTLEDLGIDNFGLASTFIKEEFKKKLLYTVMTCVSMDSELEKLLLNNEKAKECYEFHFMKQFNGVPCAGGVEIEAISSSTLAEDARSPEVLYPHEPEEIIVQVDDSGIVAFEYHAPSFDKEIENTDVQTISLDEAKEKFLNQIRYENVWAFPKDKVNMKIDKVTKLMVKILMKDNFTEEYRYVPAYTFYGTKEVENRDGSIRTEYGIVVTINAVDGSVIDRGNETFS